MKRTYKMMLVVVAGIVACGMMAAAQDAQKGVVAAKVARQARPTLPSPPFSVEPLGKTVRLVFSIKSEETQKLTIVCATRSYAMGHQWIGPEGSDQMDLSGNVSVLNDKPDHILVSFMLMQAWEGPQESGDQYLSGSAEVRLGQEVELGQNEAFTLLVEATEVE